MDAQTLKLLGQVAGIGGVAIGIFLLLFREVIRKNIFSKLTQDQSYRLMKLIIVLVWSIGLAGIAAYVYYPNSAGQPPTSDSSLLEDDLKYINAVRNGSGSEKEEALKKIDNILAVLKNNKCNDIWMQSQFWKAYIYYHNCKKTEVDAIIEELLQNAIECQHVNYEGWAYYLKGLTKDSSFSNEKSTLFNEALKRFAQDNNKQERSNSRITNIMDKLYNHIILTFKKSNYRNRAFRSSALGIALTKLNLMLVKRAEQSSITLEHDEISNLIEMLPNDEKTEGKRLKANLHLWVDSHVKEQVLDREKACEDAFKIFDELGDVTGKGYAKLRCGQIKADKGVIYYKDAIDDFNKAKEYSCNAGIMCDFAVASRLELAEMYMLHDGDIGKAEKETCAAIKLFDKNSEKKCETLYTNQCPIDSTTPDRYYIDALYGLGEIYLMQALYTNAEKIFSSVSIKREKKQNNKDMIKANIGLGEVYRNVGNFPKAKKVYTYSIELCEGDSELLATKALALVGLGKTLIKLEEGENRPNYQHVINKFMEAKRVYEEIKEQYGIALTNTALADVSVYQHNYSEAEKYYNDALKYYKVGLRNNSIDKGDIFQGLGRLAFEQHRFDDAEQWYEQASDMYRQFTNYHREANIHVYKGDLYRAKAENDAAIKEYIAALSKYAQVDNSRGNERLQYELALVNNKLGDIHIKLSRYKEANDYYDKCDKLYRNLHFANLANKCVNSKTRLNPRRG